MSKAARSRDLFGAAACVPDPLKVCTRCGRPEDAVLAMPMLEITFHEPERKLLLCSVCAGDLIRFCDNRPIPPMRAYRKEQK